MVLKNVCLAMVCTTLLAWGGRSIADEYRPDEFLSLDLFKALLSPKPLGPASEFAPVQVQAKADRGGEGGRAQRMADAKIVKTKRIVIPKTRIAHMRPEKPRAAVRTRLARRHGNPLDAQALDTRIQVWPCKSGGICNWKR
jgi:hypothetical protein